MTLDAASAAGIAMIIVGGGLLAANVLLAPVLRLLHFLAGPRQAPRPGTVAGISVVVPAYNEASNIVLKIDTLERALSRVDVEAEVIIGSDGSTDGTADVVRQRLRDADPRRWRLEEFPNEGKGRTLSKLVALATHEVIVATDADIPLPEDSIAQVVQGFRDDDRVACLSCVPCFEGLDIGRQRSYWSIEDRIRSAESLWGRLIVVTGMLCAFRKSHFEPIPVGVMADDLWVPLNVLLKGGHSRHLERLRVPYEKTDESIEIRRRTRVITGGMDVVRRLWPRLRTRTSLGLLVLAHKVNRWALPFWLALFLGGIAILFPWALAAYALLALAFVALRGPRRAALVFRTLLSPAASFAQLLRQRDFSRWEHTRKE